MSWVELFGSLPPRDPRSAATKRERDAGPDKDDGSDSGQPGNRLTGKPENLTGVSEARNAP